MDASQAGTESKAKDATTEEHTLGQAGGDTADNGVAEGTTTNGDAEDAANGASTDAAAVAPASEDTEMKGDEAPSRTNGPASSPAAPPTNGTPLSSKKANNSSHKKKTAVPEHKSKKLNKKKSKSLLNLDAKPGEYYFARMKGHPPWPSIVCDEEMLPQSLIETRPVTTKQPDGTYKKPEYADGGKRAYERTFPIMFLHTNEFAWIPNTELTLLDIEAAKEPTEKGKSKLLLAAYEKAAENQPLQHYKDMLADHQKALQEDMDAQAERDAKKASKSKRKSMDASALVDEGDEMDIDEAPSAEKPKSKKRKKDAVDSDGEGKPAKTPKTVKLSMPKTPASEPSSKKKSAKSKGSSSKKAAKVTASDDEDIVDTPKVEEKPLTPAAAKEMKEKKVLYYRHKLQRGFLSRDTMPKEDEMKSMSDFLGELEGYPDLEGSIIRTTKIHKVLKAMIKLHSIPLDGEFQFKKRSHDLLDKWTTTLSNDAAAGGSGDKEEDGKPEAADAKTNGITKKNEGQVEKAEVGEAAAPEEAKDEDMEKKIGTTVEGEKEADEEKEPEADKTAEEKKTDGPAVDSAPTEEYKPPAETAEVTA